MKAVLVTGASGFIGRATCQRLSAEGYAVRQAVRRRESAAPQYGEVVQVDDVGPQTDWSRALRGADAVVHLAARVHIEDDGAPNGEAEFRRVNVIGTRRLAAAAAAAGVQRLLLMSSAGVHGASTGARPVRETDPENPYDPYTRSKSDAERAAREIAEGARMELVVLRPPLVYGPGNPGNLLRLLKILRMRVPLPLANCRTARSMIFVENLTSAISRSLAHPAAAGKVYLVSDGEEIPLPELIKVLGQGMNVNPWLFRFPQPLLGLAAPLVGKGRDFVRVTANFVVDSSAIRSELAWAPPVSQAEALYRTTLWFTSQAN